MGTHVKGILGSFSGKVGTVVGARWKDQAVIRSLPEKSNRPPTLNQLSQRIRFELVISFTRSFQTLFQKTFRSYTKGMSVMNYAMKSVMEAVQGSYPDYFLDYSKVIVAKGSLQKADAASIASTAPGTISFTYSNNADMDGVNPDDKAVLVLYSEELNAAYTRISNATRSTGAASLLVPSLSGKEVQAWIAFVDEFGQRYSDSLYIGKLMVS